MHANRFQQVSCCPPDRKTHGVSDVILPKPRPAGTGMAEHPAINHQESQESANLAGAKRGKGVRPLKHASQKLEQSKTNACEKQANHQPAHYLGSNNFFQTLHLLPNSIKNGTFRVWLFAGSIFGVVS